MSWTNKILEVHYVCVYKNNAIYLTLSWGVGVGGRFGECHSCHDLLTETLVSIKTTILKHVITIFLTSKISLFKKVAN